MKGNTALNALWDALSEDLKPPPPNSVTALDCADKFGISLDAARMRLLQQTRGGILESGLFFDAAKKRRILHYWLKGKAK